MHRLPGEGGGGGGGGWWIGLGDGFAPPRLDKFFLFFINIMILSQFFVMLVFLCCNLYEHYSPIIKTAF